MKKIILGLSMMVAIGISSAFANEDLKVSDKVLSSFGKDFTLAKNVQWREENGYLKVRFTVADMLIEAYYSSDGEFVGSARNLLFEQLPLSVIREFNQKYNEASILSVLEVTNNEGTSYRIWLEEDNKKIKLNASSTGEITILEKRKK
ncbi:MAG: hypothetical protein JST09_00570 [Bacteroidetes bacterium]|nr:hypothetical protein [Bacteroidota bacterium]